MVEMLVDHKVEVIALCLNEAHFHLLTRFPDKEVRPLVGTAKRHAFYVCATKATAVASGQ